MGRSDLRAARSLCQHIIEHFLKLEFSGLEEPADHWRDEIVEWRVQLEQILTCSIEVTVMYARSSVCRRVSNVAATLVAVPIASSSRPWDHSSRAWAVPQSVSRSSEG